jgi:hypothetical protein
MNRGPMGRTLLPWMSSDEGAAAKAILELAKTEAVSLAGNTEIAAWFGILETR